MVCLVKSFEISLDLAEDLTEGLEKIKEAASGSVGLLNEINEADFSTDWANVLMEMIDDLPEEFITEFRGKDMVKRLTKLSDEVDKLQDLINKIDDLELDADVDAERLADRLEWAKLGFDK